LTSISSAVESIVQELYRLNISSIPISKSDRQEMDTPECNDDERPPRFDFNDPNRANLMYGQ